MRGRFLDNRRRRKKGLLACEASLTWLLAIDIDEKCGIGFEANFLPLARCPELAREFYQIKSAREMNCFGIGKLCGILGNRLRKLPLEL